MSGLTPAAGRPPLTYSLPGFQSGAYELAPQWLDTLRTLGFRWVTFHPTYPVWEETPLRIGPGPEIPAAVACARGLGFGVRIEPHLDWAISLSGGPYRWRRDMRLKPDDSYYDQVLAPLALLRPDELTLGSELDISAYEFALEWAGLAARLVPSGIALGHKLNHDWQDARGVRGRWRPGVRRNLDAYLGVLDYVALSWYVPDRRPFPPGYAIGEFGLGSTDTTRPWHFDESAFRTPADFAVRTRWYIETLEWIARSGSTRAACFWTAGHFDVLGVMHPEWRDDIVVEAVREYNHASP